MRSSRKLGPEGSAKVMISIVRQYPGVGMTLQLDPGYKDQALLKAIAEFPDPVKGLNDVLKSQGCREETRLKACSYLPMALVMVSAKKTYLCARRTRCALITLAVIVEVILLSAAVALVVMMAGQRSGTCKLDDFWDRECVQSTAQTTACDFNVNIMEPADSGVRVFGFRWTPPATYDYMLNRYVWNDSPFLCCDDRAETQRRSCCDLADDRGNMCDNWADRSDLSGNPCHTGPWSCVFRTRMVGSDTEEVVYLDVKRGTPILPLFISAGAVALLTAGLCAYWWTQQRSLVNMQSTKIVHDIVAPSSWEELYASPKPLEPGEVGWDAPVQRQRSASVGSHLEVASNMASLPGAVPEPPWPQKVPTPSSISPRILDVRDDGDVNLPATDVDFSTDFSKFVDHAAIEAQLRPIVSPSNPRRPRGGGDPRGQLRSTGSSAGSRHGGAQRGASAGRRSAGRARAP